MNVSFRFDDGGIGAGLRRAATSASRAAVQQTREDVRSIVVPVVKEAVPTGKGEGGHLRDKVKGGATARGGYVEIVSPYVGLVNYGGTRRDSVRPKRKGGALATPAGARAATHGPRTYRAQHFLERGGERGAAKLPGRAADAAAAETQRCIG